MPQHWVSGEQLRESLGDDRNTAVRILSSLPGLAFTVTDGPSAKALGYSQQKTAIIAQARKVHDFLTVGAPHPLQEAVVTALRFPLDYYTKLTAAYTARRDIFLGYLRAAGLTFSQPQGAYYVLVDIAAFGHASDTAFCHWLAREIGVAAVPGSSFFAEPVDHLVRFHFAKKRKHFTRPANGCCV